MATSQRLRGMFSTPSDAETEMWAVSVWQLHSNFLFGSGATTGWLISLHLPTGTHCTLMQYDCSTTNHPPTPGDVFKSIQMLIALHRQKRWAFAEWCKEQNADTAITSSKKDRSQQPTASLPTLITRRTEIKGSALTVTSTSSAGGVAPSDCATLHACTSCHARKACAVSASSGSKLLQAQLTKLSQRPQTTSQKFVTGSEPAHCS